jgi:hypothetical protein
MATTGIVVHTCSLGDFKLEGNAELAYKALTDDGYVVLREACSVDEAKRENPSFQPTILFNKVHLCAPVRRGVSDEHLGCKGLVIPGVFIGICLSINADNSPSW